VPERRTSVGGPTPARGEDAGGRAGPARREDAGWRAGLLVAVDIRLAFTVTAVPVLAAGAWLLGSPATRALGVSPPRR
jgi:hypothetical protein